MPPITTIPTTMPKASSNFSIDWIVKNDKNVPSNNNNNNNNISSITKSAEKPLSHEDNLMRDYDKELSKALRLSPSDLQPTVPMKRIESPSHLNDYLHCGQPMPSSEQPPMKTTMPAAAMHFDQSKINYEQEQRNHAIQSSLAAMQHTQLLNAQLQMAAAFSHQQHQHQQQQQQQRQAAAAAVAASRLPQTMDFSQIFSSNFQRTPYPLQPWMMNRYGRMMPHGFASDFLLHPYRKPKRIRTAFAPLQLLELENAFEGNQYVVGSERKALAKTLNLTETQVRNRSNVFSFFSPIFVLVQVCIQMQLFLSVI